MVWKVLMSVVWLSMKSYPFDMTYEFRATIVFQWMDKSLTGSITISSTPLKISVTFPFLLWLEYPRDEYVLNAADAELETVSTDAPIALSNFHIFPNPTSDEFQVSLELTESLDCSLMLYSSDGKAALPVFNGTLTQGTHQIGAVVRDLAAGTYFLHLRSASGLSIQTVQINR